MGETTALENMNRRRDVEGYASNFGMSLAEFEEFMGDSNPKKILDLGCGQGKFIGQLDIDEFRKLGIQIVGVDKYIIGKDAASNLVRADFAHLPFPSDSFDIVLGSSSVGMYSENMEGLKMDIAELSRVLKIGGKAIIVAKPDVKVIEAIPGFETFEERKQYGRLSLAANSFEIRIMSSGTVPNPLKPLEYTYSTFSAPLTDILAASNLHIQNRRMSKEGYGLKSSMSLELIKGVPAQIK